MTRGVPILMYHSVSDDPGPGARAHAVTPAAFGRQLGWLADAGFTAVTASRAAGLLRGEGAMPAKPIAITFDDGYADFVDNALPRLERFGFTATVFVTTGWVAASGSSGSTGGGAGPGGGVDGGSALGRMLSWRQIEELSAHGVEIGGHSRTHPELDQLDQADASAEVARCLVEIEHQLGRPVTSFAYPYGYSSGPVRQAVAAAGYTCAFAVDNAVAGPASDRFALPRLTIAGPDRPSRFDDLVHGRRIPLVYARRRALSRGYESVRRARRAGRAWQGRREGRARTVA